MWGTKSEKYELPSVIFLNSNSTTAILNPVGTIRLILNLLPVSPNHFSVVIRLSRALICNMVLSFKAVMLAHTPRISSSVLLKLSLTLVACPSSGSFPHRFYNSACHFCFFFVISSCASPDACLHGEFSFVVIKRLLAVACQFLCNHPLLLDLLFLSVPIFCQKMFVYQCLAQFLLFAFCTRYFLSFLVESISFFQLYSIEIVFFFVKATFIFFSFFSPNTSVIVLCHGFLSHLRGVSDRCRCASSKFFYWLDDIIWSYHDLDQN